MKRQIIYIKYLIMDSETCYSTDVVSNLRGEQLDMFPLLKQEIL